MHVARSEWRLGKQARRAGILLGAVAFLIPFRLTQNALTLQARGQPFDVVVLLKIELAYWITWAMLALAILALLDFAAGSAGSRLTRITRIVMSGVVTVAITFYVQPVLNASLYWWMERPVAQQPGTPFMSLVRRVMIGSSMNNLQIVIALLGVALAAQFYAGFRDRDRAARALEDQLATARLDILRAQLNPHFLFNSMNTIAMLARKGASDDVVRMVSGLSDFLRETLDDGRPQVISLGRELEFVRHYVAIERVRFGERLHVQIEVSPEALDVAVPSFLLQPLVENAIRHGVEPQPGSGTVSIRAALDAGMLAVDIQDDGVGMSSGSPSDGVGLRNSRARLAQLYGDAASLVIRSADDGGTIVSVRIPDAAEVSQS